jgi:exopolysaccharide biosynthesis polyprenyl glycosylphosphotransferase
MKKAELVLSFLLVPLDYLMIVLAGLTAYFIRFSETATAIRPVIFELPFVQYFQGLLIISGLCLPIFALAGLYTIRSARKLTKESYRVVLACSTGLVLVVVIIFIRRELFDSRFIILAGWALAIVYIIIARSLIRWLQRKLYSYSIGTRKVVLIGDSRTADNLIQKFSKDKDFGYEVVKRFRNFSSETASEALEFIKNNEVDEIIQADPNISKSQRLRLYDFADENHIIFKYAADLLGTKVLKTELMEIAGVPIVEVKKTPLDGWGRIVKRLMDAIGSFLLIMILSPIFIITAILIKLDSRGPVFFSYKDDGTPLYRVGQGGRLFHYFKFRSMVPGKDSMRYHELSSYNTRSDGPLVKIQNDPRITKVGHFIRRWSIDELPELFLVLVGKMSLVGPRPHLPEEVARYEHHHKKSLTIKPGVTGLAQISGRSDLSFEEEVKLDTYYIENWSLLLDISILLRTPLAVIKSRKAE